MWYVILKANHNCASYASFSVLLFRISKIQIFESKSQLRGFLNLKTICCSEYQRYKFLKANHNAFLLLSHLETVVQNIKDTNFWKQITTTPQKTSGRKPLFRISKIQIFESKSQQFDNVRSHVLSCLSDQRYNFLKANHNWIHILLLSLWVVYQIKDTIFWKQINIRSSHIHYPACFYILWFEIY